MRPEQAVPTGLVKQIVEDFRRGVPEPSSGMVPPPAPMPTQPGGPPKEVPIQPPPGIQYVDRIAEAFAERERSEEVMRVVMMRVLGRLLGGDR
jgi:hypothetical protein